MQYFYLHIKYQIHNYLFLRLKKHLRTLPPILNDNELPSISVITLLHNRRKFVDLAFTQFKEVLKNQKVQEIYVDVDIDDLVS